MSWTDIPDWSLIASRAIMETVRVKDVETYHHCIRVSQGSRLLAKAAGLNEIEQKIAEFAGLFHDIGKIGIPDAILLKPGRLTPEEIAVMNDHPELSVKILEPLTVLDFYKRLIPGVRFHHERFDGSGYPACKKGEDIPLTSRIILVADTFDAMTADRAYRKGRAAEVAYKELIDCSGTQFDPHLAKIFVEAHPTWDAHEKKVFDEMNHQVLKAA